MENEKVTNEIIVPLFCGWTVEDIDPHYGYRGYSHTSMYLAITKLDEDGKEDRIYLPQSKEDDRYFNIHEAKQGDILVAGAWREIKRRGKKVYYVVISKDTEELHLIEFSTLLKAVKYLKAL